MSKTVTFTRAETWAVKFALVEFLKQYPNEDSCKDMKTAKRKLGTFRRKGLYL